MKKIISVITAAVIASLVFTGCSYNAVEKENNIPDVPDNTQIEQVGQEQNENKLIPEVMPDIDKNSQSGTEGEDKEEQQKQQNVMSPDEMLDAAFSMIDHPVDEFYSLIGEPEDKSYASSCMGDGQDGELYYPGFTVCTYLDGDTETVVDAYK